MSKQVYKSVEDLPLVLTVQDVGNILSLSKNVAYELVHSEGFPVIKVGKLYRVPKASFLSWLDSSGMAKIAYQKNLDGGMVQRYHPPTKERRGELKMSKRANGEGSISHRNDGRWLVTMPTGLRTPNGKLEYIYRYGKTQAEAAEILRKLQAEKGIGISHKKSRITTGEWLEAWVRDYKPKLAPTTRTSYQNNLRIHIIPAIGAIPLYELETYHIKRMLEKAGGSSSKYIKIRNIVQGALAQAVELRMIANNPCKGVPFPKDDATPSRAFTMEEQATFVAALDGEYYRPLFLTYLYTGMRLGEAIPLWWADVDLEQRTIRVGKKAIVVHDWESHTAPQLIQDFCKTKSSTRLISITVGLATVLAEHKKKQREQAEKSGLPWSEENILFPNTRGKMAHGRNVQCAFYKVLERAGIDHTTLHGLRHTYATRCFEAGIELKALSELLGHASVKTTADIYVHLLPKKSTEEVDKLTEVDKLLA